MAKKTQVLTEPQQPSLKVSLEVAERLLVERIQKGIELMDRDIYFIDAERSIADYYKWNDYNRELLKTMFDNNTLADEYVGFFFGDIGGDTPLFDERDDFVVAIQRKIDKLDSIKSRLPLFTILINNSTNRIRKQNTENNRVFIVHGWNDTIKIDVARTLEKLGLEAIILHEQVNAGKTVIEKLESYSDVGFAVIILTPDDEGKSKAEHGLRDRARQNVIAELGYFVGKLGRNKVCPLYVDGVEIPSDFNGVVYVPLDTAGRWKFDLARELKAAGYSVDLNKIFG